MDSLRAQDNFYPDSRHCFTDEGGQNSVQGTYTPCCWTFVSLVSVGEGKDVIFYGDEQNFVHIYRDNILHLESKERLGNVSVLR